MSGVLRKLQGGNLEVFKFGMYILFPIGWMYYFGTNLEERFSVRDFWPTAEQSHKIPESVEEIDRELTRMRMLDGMKRERRQKELQQQQEAAATASHGAEEAASP